LIQSVLAPHKNLFVGAGYPLPWRPTTGWSTAITTASVLAALRPALCWLTVLRLAAVCFPTVRVDECPDPEHLPGSGEKPTQPQEQPSKHRNGRQPEDGTPHPGSRRPRRRVPAIR
jgi:hypothetical protein